jgi:hypothetical protein
LMGTGDCILAVMSEMNTANAMLATSCVIECAATMRP